MSSNLVPIRKQPLHVLQVVGEPVGGIRKHIHSIIEGLDESRFLCSYVYSSKSSDSRFSFEINSLRSRIQAELQLRIEKKPHLSDLVNLWKLTRFVKKNKIDILHGHGAKGGLYARIVGMICRVPAIYTPHGGVVHGMFGFWENKLYIFVERCLARITHCFIFESNYTAESFLAKVGTISRPWCVNHNGIDCLKIGLPDIDVDFLFRSEINIGVFGVLRPEKGQIHLINAVSLILKLGKINIRLHVFGDGSDRKYLSNAVKELGLVENVVFYGDVANAEDHIIKMDIIVIPSLFESFGYLGLEAMALSKPVIASSVGGLKEIFDGETALLIAPGDSTVLSQSIIRLVKDPELLFNMVQRGRQRCEAKFSLIRMINTLENEYRSSNAI